MGYSKAPKQLESSARPICHFHTMTSTGHEPASMHIAAYRSSSHGRQHCMTKHKHKEQNISYYSASIINRDVEGILWVQLTCKQTREMFRLCVRYLPPVGSFRKLCAQGFYDSLLTHIYMYQTDCPFVICGDFKDRRYYLAVQRAQIFMGKNNRAVCPTRVRL